MTILNLTQQLMRIRSVTSNQDACREVLDVIATMFEDIPQAHVEFSQDAGVHSMIVKNFDGKRADICFNAHVDVVPPQDESQREPRIEGDFLYGRGSGDMKDGVALISLLMKELCSTSPLIKGDGGGFFQQLSQGREQGKKKLMLMLTADEEIGGDHGVEFLVNQGYGGDIVLVPDGGNLHEIVIGEKGVLNIALIAIGKAGHSSRPWEYDNAIEKLMLTYTQIKQSIETSALMQAPDHRGCSVQLTTIQGGQASNMIPGDASGTLNIRFTEVTSQEEIMTKILAICDAIGGVTAELKMKGGVLFTDPSHPILQQYLNIANKTLGDCKFSKEHGASDGRFFAEKGSIVILQKPTCFDIHGKDERTTISDFERIYEVYKEFVLSL